MGLNIFLIKFQRKNKKRSGMQANDAALKQRSNNIKIYQP